MYLLDVEELSLTHYVQNWDNDNTHSIQSISYISS